MISQDLFNIAQWWLVFFFLGITFLPMTILLLADFFDQGYIFAKILGLLLLSFFIWLAASFKLLTFSFLNLFLLMILAFLINLYLLWQKNLFPKIRKNLPVYLAEESLFLLGLIFWTLVRGFEPSIHGLEKFMDFGFVNSILQSQYFPPKDIWLTPFSINYYYFGHLTAAVLTKMSGLDSMITYNLMIAVLFALTLTASFSLGTNLYYLFSRQSKQSTSHPKIYAVLCGLLASFLVALGGNLHTIYLFFQSYTPAENPLPFWQLPLAVNFLSYWYPNATRFIPFTIHEFPIYSFVVADLHGHVSNIPFVLLIIALLIKIYHQTKLLFFDFGLLSLLTAASLMTNVLDGPIYLLVIFLVFTIRFSLSIAFKNLTLIILGAIFFSLPFWLSFTPFGSGIGILCAPDFLTKIGKVGPFLFEANHCLTSPFWMLAILWGFFFFAALGFLLFIVRKNHSLPPIDNLVLILAASAILLILIPELVYVKDIYPAHYRANTVFKFGYQAFIILGLISGYILTRLLSLPVKTLLYRLYALPLAFFFFLVSIYPYFAVNSYYGNLTKYQGLDGLSYLLPLYPADYQAILWLRKNIQGQPVILEAQGDSYTDFARVSANTGLPTVVGWPVHEWLWRGSYDEAGKRSTEVTTLYTSSDLNLTKQLLEKYRVEYVFVGALERQKYPNLNELKFSQMGKIVFQSGQTRIYQIVN